jgi:hypothetical protein
MAVSATVTGVTGPAKALTATVFSNIRSLTLDASNGNLSIVTNTGRVVDISCYAATTCTVTVASNAWSVTVQQ